MGEVAKNPIPQLVPQAVQPSPRLFITDPAKPARTMSLKAAQQLSQFVPVIVMVPAGATGESGIPPAAAARNATPAQNAGAALLLEFLQTTYEAAATTANWDREALECAPGVPGVPRG